MTKFLAFWYRDTAGMILLRSATACVLATIIALSLHYPPTSVFMVIGAVAIVAAMRLVLWYLRRRHGTGHPEAKRPSRPPSAL